jgi:hypothetical protein
VRHFINYNITLILTNKK